MLRTEVLKGPYHLTEPERTFQTCRLKSVFISIKIYSKQDGISVNDLQRN